MSPSASPSTRPSPNPTTLLPSTVTDAKQPHPLPTRKRKAPPRAQVQTSSVLRHPPWTYLHLSLQPGTSDTLATSIDAPTVRLHLTAALTQFLGLHGSAIPVDILHLREREVWVRIPREDAAGVVAGLSSWVGANGTVGWRVRGRSEWLGRLVGGDGRDLFGAE